MDDVKKITDRAEVERLCDAACRLGLAQLPLFRAAADGWLSLFRIDRPGTAWPARMVERQTRPVCFLIGGDQGFGYPDPKPSEWVCARRLKYWCQNAGAIIHGAGGELPHYREAVAATLLLQRLALIETTSRNVDAWAAFLGSRKMLLIRPSLPHPIAERPGTVH